MVMSDARRSLVQRLRARKCARRGHDPMLKLEPREFLPVTDICWTCGQSISTLPYGDCLNTRSGTHPLALHYVEVDGVLRVVGVGDCPQPR